MEKLPGCVTLSCDGLLKSASAGSWLIDANVAESIDHLARVVVSGSTATDRCGRAQATPAPTSTPQRQGAPADFLER